MTLLPLGPGRQLLSALDVNGCAATLNTIRTPTVQPGWSWLGPADRSPTGALACFNENGDLLFVGFRPDGEQTAISVIPLVGGDETATLRIWARVDPSLRGAGPLPGGLVALQPPPLPDVLVDDILLGTGRPDTEHARDEIAALLTEQINRRAGQLVGTTNPARGRRFEAGHHWRHGSGLSIARRALADLADQDPRLLRYVQDLPMRCRASLLTAGSRPA